MLLLYRERSEGGRAWVPESGQSIIIELLYVTWHIPIATKKLAIEDNGAYGGTILTVGSLLYFISPRRASTKTVSQKVPKGHLLLFLLLRSHGCG
jgi:hypothetical protein